MSVAQLERGTKSLSDRVRVKKRSQLTIPKPIMDALHLEEGDQLDISVDDNGRIILEPTVAVPKAQAYFWTEEWQAGERKADEDIKAGRMKLLTNLDDLEAFFARLDPK